MKTVVGTGGIGTGIIYQLEGDHDLGRNETRFARRVDQRDFCKLHIVFHYVATLSRATVLPIGAVGDDAEGRTLLALMQQTGMNVRYTRVLEGARTLFAVCYQFPDGSGGNLTELRSASDRVTLAMIRQAKPDLGSQSVAVALPEVPLASRLELLRLAKQRGAVTVASFVTDEIPEARRSLKLVDVLSINRDEAAALAGLSSRQTTRQIVEACRRLHPQVRLCVTAGQEGLYGPEHLPALKVKVANTAGAGDAVLAGLIVGIVNGQDWDACLRLGRLLSAMSVTSPDTIHFGINWKTLRTFSRRKQW